MLRCIASLLSMVLVSLIVGTLGGRGCELLPCVRIGAGQNACVRLFNVYCSFVVDVTCASLIAGTLEGWCRELQRCALIGAGRRALCQASWARSQGQGFLGRPV